MIIKILTLLLTFSLLAACCPTGTTVVLIPDAGGKIGRVSVATKAGSALLTHANESTSAIKTDEQPSQRELLPQKKINDIFGATLAKEPAPPEHFRLYFASGSADLAGQTSDELAKAKASMQTRKSCDMSVIGHSDTVGDNSTNRGLSLKRAENVANALRNSGVTANCFDIRYYGENDPLVPTADNVDEPRNRRVEVEIR